MSDPDLIARALTLVEKAETLRARAEAKAQVSLAVSALLIGAWARGKADPPAELERLLAFLDRTFASAEGDDIALAQSAAMDSLRRLAEAVMRDLPR